jgi:DNA repair exonuclease SbcCD ATPase subunit
MNLKQLQKEIEQQKGKMLELKSTARTLRKKIRINEKKYLRLEEAAEIVKSVAQSSQQQLQFHISDIASLALEGIFPNPYKLVLDFVNRRNKIECDILFERNGVRMKPKDASGGGAIDIAAFALRVACWSMMSPRTRNTIILDEPLRFLSVDKREAASKMIQQISQKLGVQFIIITHSPYITAYADRAFKTTINRKGITKVTQI